MVRYEPALDVESLRAIDVHVHVEIDGHGHASLPDDLAAAASRYFAVDAGRPDLDSIAEYYRDRSMAAIVFTVDAESHLGHPPLSSVDIAAGAARHYDVLQAAGVVALFHTGQTGIGAGMKGGRGLRLGLSNPMLLDGVAADFGDLQIIMAHPSVPWQDEAISVATHKHNTWIDLSGWSPKYFPEQLVRAANSFLKSRILFGSDFPLLTPDRWLRDVEQTALKAEVMPGILRDNAARLLGLSTPPKEHS
ncbi:MAG: putative metal-dependent hydrolase of the TIM-barrel fold [Microbacterium sp.]|nr:putative metal-dependent hydrolase of the TIM-barrel fold [Microbacterium sp.]